MCIRDRNTPRANVLIPTLSVRLPAAANTNVTATPPFILILPPIVPLPRSFLTNVSMLPARIMPDVYKRQPKGSAVMWKACRLMPASFWS